MVQAGKISPEMEVGTGIVETKERLHTELPVNKGMSFVYIISV